LAGVVVALAAAAAVAAGCGGGTDGGGATPAATDYPSCLRANGVTLPTAGADARPSGPPTGRPSGAPAPGADGGPGGAGRPSGGPPSGGPPNGGPSGRPGLGFGSQAPNGVDQQAWEKAQKACAGLRPSGGPSGGPGTRDNGAQAAYRTCLRDHGVTVTGRIDDLDTSDPKVAAALQTCAPLRPSPSAS
jgi:hypothetical protein